MSSRAAVATILALVFVGLGTVEAQPQPASAPAPGQDPCPKTVSEAIRINIDRPASSTWNINEAMRHCLYEKLAGQSAPLAESDLKQGIQDLNDLLDSLVNLDGPIAKLGPGLADDTILYDAEAQSRGGLASWLGGIQSVDPGVEQARSRSATSCETPYVGG